MGHYDDKWVRELEADNDRMRAAVHAALATITPENVRLGHTWLRRKMKEAMDAAWRVDEQNAVRKCTACGDMKIDDLVEGITDENRHPETKW